MKTKFPLFDSHPFLRPLSEHEAAEIRKLICVMGQSQKHLPGLKIPSVISDHMILYFIKMVKDEHISIPPQVWIEFLEELFHRGLIEQLQSPSLKHYLMIQMAKTLSLVHFIDEIARQRLAYSALHSNEESRRILLGHIKHFELNNPKMMADIAFKGVLLGGANYIDLLQFESLPYPIIKQLIFLIAKVNPTKAKSELKKISIIHPQALTDITPHLLAS